MISFPNAANLSTLIARLFQVEQNDNRGNAVNQRAVVLEKAISASIRERYIPFIEGLESGRISAESVGLEPLQANQAISQLRDRAEQLPNTVADVINSLLQATPEQIASLESVLAQPLEAQPPALRLLHPSSFNENLHFLRTATFETQRADYVSRVEDTFYQLCSDIAMVVEVNDTYPSEMVNPLLDICEAQGTSINLSVIGGSTSGGHGAVRGERSDSAGGSGNNGRSPKGKLRRFLERGALALSVMGVGAAATAGYVYATVPQVREYKAAAEAREPLAINLGFPIQDATIDAAWEEHFADNPGIIPRQAWNGRIGRSLGTIANKYYNRYLEENGWTSPDQAPRTIDEFYREYLQSIIDEAETQGVDPAMHVTMMAISGENMVHPDSLNKDMEIGRIQLLAQTLASAGDALPLVERRQIENMLIEMLSGREGLLPAVGAKISDDVPIPKFDAARFPGMVTLGDSDIELERIANGIFEYQTPEFIERFKSDYPDAYDVLKTVYDLRQDIDSQKITVRGVAEDFLFHYGDAVDVFFSDPELSEQYFERIGMGREGVAPDNDHSFRFGRTFIHVAES
jgi:hypothetical protein